MKKVSIPPVVAPADLEELLGSATGVRMLDVRTPAEYEALHIRGSYNVPLDRLGEHARDLRSVRDPVVLICRSGARAKQAEETLRGAGMPQLHLLEGGVNAWVAEGRPVERGPERLPLDRQVRVAAGALAAVGGVLALAVSPAFGLVPALIGGGLVYAGLTDRCGMGLVLTRLPHNRPATCDVDEMVRALKEGQALPAHRPRGSASPWPATDERRRR